MNPLNRDKVIVDGWVLSQKDNEWMVAVFFLLKKYIWMNGWCLLWIYNNIILISVPLPIPLSVKLQGD